MTDDDVWSKEYRSRSFGFFHEKETAVENVLNNTNDMHECRYMYVVIEKIYPGIHPIVTGREDRETWFTYDLEEDCWKEIDFRPNNYNGIINFSLG